MDDSILLIRDHMIDVCMDLVSTEEEDVEDIREDFTEMVDILLEATDLTVKDAGPSTDGKSRIFNCTIELITPED
jgi:hypothetical protein